MKRTLGVMASNWLRKPENQEKVKRTARQLWDRFQERQDSGNTKSNNTTPSQSSESGRRNTRDERSTDQTSSTR